MVDINGIFAKTGIVKGRPWHTFFSILPINCVLKYIYLNQKINTDLNLHFLISIQNNDIKN